MFDVFDYPDPSEVRGRRDVTTVAPQALFLMNDDFVLNSARQSATRILSDEAQNSRVSRVNTAYRRTLGRPPSRQERQEIITYLAEQISASAKEGMSKTESRQEAWSRVYHALFSTAEFRYRL